MTLDPHMKALADLLVSIAARELMNERTGKEKAGPVKRPGDLSTTNNRSVSRYGQYTERNPARI